MAAPVALADGQVGPVTVPSKAVIYAAGQPNGKYARKAGGVNPVSIALGSDPASVTFPTVSGTITCNVNNGAAYNGPDGGVCNKTPNTNVGPANSLSQIKGDTYLPLVGVFLAGGAPTGSAPAATDFTGNRDFRNASPQLHQVFFIGDGHNANGKTQTFDVPAGATTLWLGIADSTNSKGGVPSNYRDNGGSFSVTAGIVAGPSGALPEARYAVFLPILALGAGGTVLVRRTRRRSSTGPSAS